MTTHEEFYCHVAEHGEDEKIIDEREDITIEFVYPLRNPVRLMFSKKGGFTRGAFISAVGRGYARIYREEDESRTTSPEPSGMLLNRSATDGVHGIWGHDLADLMLEGADRDDDGIWHLGIGS